MEQEVKDKIRGLQQELKNCRDELCMRCGSYKTAHLGSCDGCRYARDGEWTKHLKEED